MQTYAYCNEKVAEMIDTALPDPYIKFSTWIPILTVKRALQLSRHPRVCLEPNVYQPAVFKIIIVKAIS
jgi:hypothetical protein